MNNVILSKDERDFLAQMEAHDREIENEFQRRFLGKWNLPKPEMQHTQHEPPVNCRCTIVWPQEAAEEALNHG